MDWPFIVVPNEASCTFIADRKQLNIDVQNLLRNLSRHSASSMHLMWAWFGSGKTHTLKYINYLCKKDFKGIIPIYIEFPKATKNFLDLYKSFMEGIDIDVINDAYLEVSTCTNKDKISKELDFSFFDLSKALKLLYMGTYEQQIVALNWLRLESRDKQILKKIGVTKAIQTTGEALKVIEWIIKLINNGSSSTGEIQRILWIIDEYQRIEKLRKIAIEEINSCLHSIFNSFPNGLSIIISFSGYPEEKKLPYWLSPEIRDRLDKKPFLLPPLTDSESLIFIKDLLNHYRPYSYDNSNIFFPFTQDSVDTILKFIKNNAKKAKLQDEPKPRTLMHVFNLVLQEADTMIEYGKLDVIDNKFALKILSEISIF